MQFRSGRYASLLRAIARCFASRQIILRGSFIGSYLNKEEQHAPRHATFHYPERERERDRIAAFLAKGPLRLTEI